MTHAFDTLRRLESGGRLEDCVVRASGKGIMNGSQTVYGRCIKRFNRSFLEFCGGETGRESLRIPMHNIQSIEHSSRLIFIKKKVIERIYFRH